MSRAAKKSKGKEKTDVSSIKNALTGELKIRSYRIPKEKLENALKLLENGGMKSEEAIHLIRGNCHLKTHKNDTGKRGIMQTDNFPIILKECRNAILKHDWRNLARLLACAKKPVSIDRRNVYSHVFLKYATLCVLNDPLAKKHKVFERYMESINRCDTKEERMDFLREILTISIDR